jgi:hypothetical protein
VLLWYEGVDLKQLENCHKGGLDIVDLVALHHRACAIVECTNMDEFFNADGVTAKGEDEEEVEVSSFTEPTAKMPEDISSEPAVETPKDTGFE